MRFVGRSAFFPRGKRMSVCAGIARLHRPGSRRVIERVRVVLEKPSPKLLRVSCEGLDPEYFPATHFWAPVRPSATQQQLYFLMEDSNTVTLENVEAPLSAFGGLTLRLRRQVCPRRVYVGTARLTFTGDELDTLPKKNPDDFIFLL